MARSTQSTENMLVMYILQLSERLTGDLAEMIGVGASVIVTEGAMTVRSKTGIVSASKSA
jgi:hypothetical protein